MIISIIAAVSRNNVIGHGGRLPWRIPEDLRAFKRRTTGHFVVMGRKTFDSIGKPLPGRKLLILSRRQGLEIPGVLVVSSFEEAVAVAQGENEQELFVAGGEEIYRIALPVAHRIYLTRIEQDYEGDIFFPEVDWSNWQQTQTRNLGEGINLITYFRRDDS